MKLSREKGEAQKILISTEILEDHKKRAIQVYLSKLDKIKGFTTKLNSQEQSVTKRLLQIDKEIKDSQREEKILYNETPKQKQIQEKLKQEKIDIDVRLRKAKEQLQAVNLVKDSFRIFCGLEEDPSEKSVDPKFPKTPLLVNISKTLGEIVGDQFKIQSDKESYFPDPGYWTYVPFVSIPEGNKEFAKQIFNFESTRLLDLFYIVKNLRNDVNKNLTQLDQAITNTSMDILALKNLWTSFDDKLLETRQIFEKREQWIKERAKKDSVDLNEDIFDTVIDIKESLDNM